MRSRLKVASTSILLLLLLFHHNTIIFGAPMPPASPTNNNFRNSKELPQRFSPHDFVDSARRRRKGMPALSTEDLTSVENSMLLPIRGVGHTDFAGAGHLQQIMATTPEPFSTSHFSWGTEVTPIPHDEEHIPPEFVTHEPIVEQRKGSLASLPSISTRSASSISSYFPYPKLDEANVMDNVTTPLVPSERLPNRPKYPAPPKLAKEARGNSIPGSHYRVLPSGDFYCEHCGYVFQNCHKIC